MYWMILRNVPWKKEAKPITSVFEDDPALAKIKLKHHLIEELATLEVDDAREVIRFAKPGYHLSRNQPGGKRTRREGMQNVE
jgi:hypothetical protein